jgi:pSer/pThr/pTyr-binding forkhead associated (FHA) protein
MHAVLKAEGNGTLILLDQLSESGTFVRAQGGEEQQLSGDRAILKHGDMVRFGSRSFKVSLLD